MFHAVQIEGTYNPETKETRHYLMDGDIRICEVTLEGDRVTLTQKAFDQLCDTINSARLAEGRQT